MALNIVLVEPEIPQNTGNVARTCAAVGARLHLVHPLGFTITDSKLKRAGMDYWYQVEVIHHKNFEAFWNSIPHDKVWLSTTKAFRLHSEVRFADEDYLIFGKESAGLPEEVLEQNLNRTLRIPMLPERRSLNLSSAVAVVTYEALRQLNFPNLQNWGPRRDGSRFT
jgi:tRNA (cytidine/uridine-2'-O-)-methyltransferase